MRLDELARDATGSLLEGTSPDTAALLADLKRVRRRRSTARSITAAVAIVAVVGGWAAIRDSGDGKPKPAAPAYRNGALLIAGSDIRVVAGGGEPLILPEDYQGDGDVAFTADGSELLYNNPRQRMEAIDVETGETRVVTPCSSSSRCSTALSPDGRWLAQPDHGGIRLREVDGSGERLLPTQGVQVLRVSWSPDGRSLTLSSQDGLYTMAATGSEPRPLVEFTGSRPVPGALQWSPDGQMIAFLEARRLPGDDDLGIPSDRFLLRLVEPDGSGLRTLGDLGDCYCARGPGPSFAWAPDSSVIATTRVKTRPGRPTTPRPDGVYLVGLDGHAERISGGPSGQLVWRPIPED